MANRNEQLIGQLNLAAHFHDLIGHQMSDLGVSLHQALLQSQKMTVRSVVTLRTFMTKMMNHKMNIHQLPQQRRKEENWI